MYKTGILTAAKGYSIDDIAPWVSSLKETGFDGKVFVILYQPTEDVANYLKDNDFYVLVAEHDSEFHIATQRFKDYANALDSGYFEDIDLVIHTDIRDVIFQENPETWLRNNIDEYQIVATGEGVTYRHEDWNGDGMELHFGKTAFQQMIDYETLCSGIIAGRKDILQDLFTSICEIIQYTANVNGFIDQHAYNLIIRKCFSDVTKIVSGDSEWVGNLGTLAAIPESNPSWSTGPRTEISSYERFRKGTYVENMLVGLPYIDQDGIVYNPNNKPYAIIHQYDRLPNWRKKIYENKGYEKNVNNF